MEFEQVMGQTNQVPLAADFAQTAQEKLPEAARPLDLPESGLDGFLAFAVGQAAAEGSQLARHAFFDRGVLGKAAMGRQHPLAVFLSPGGKIGVRPLAVRYRSHWVR